MDENLKYLAENFVSLDALMDATELDAGAIGGMVAAQIIPRACYFPDDDGNLASNLGSAATKLDTTWFHPASAAWVLDARALLQSDIDANALADQRRRWFMTAYMDHLKDLRELGLIEPAAWDDAFSDEASAAAIAKSEFNHWIAGTYGLCTRANTPEAVAVKECMVRNVDHLTGKGRKADLDAAGRGKMVRYLRLFDHVAALFAPFERATSSRQRLCVELPRQYGVAIS